MIKRLIICLTVMFFGWTIMPALPAQAAFNPLQSACQKAPESPACKQATNQGTKDPIAGENGILSTAANLIALVTGIGAVVMILIGAFFHITSAGNTEKVAKARSRIISGFIGLVIVALAWAIVRFVVDKLL
ncbi:hypothetical protein HY380_00295 [Candidatus Saccharibacteria bacterium]|nr:hypothetical protein [Candidatus Saccharibacteria bacterium]